MSPKLVSLTCFLVLSLAAWPANEANAATVEDLRRAAPADAHMAVYGKHNPERDYQREYLKEAWETAREEHIGERILKIITSRVPEEKLDEAKSRWEEISDALEPISVKALANAEEFVFAQQMVGIFNQQLVAFRLSDESAAEDCERGLTQGFELAAKWSDGKVPVEETEVGEVKVTTLRLPKESPFHPGVARIGDVIIFSTGPHLLTASIEQLQSESGESKFDDPRFKEAIEHLPEAEDVVVFFDGRQLWKGLGGVGDFIRAKAPDEEKAQRAAKLMDRFVEEVSILDYEISVEYTEDGQNRAAAIGKLMENAEEKLLAKALTQGEPFEDWQSWIPAEATGFSLHSGVNLHVLYEGILEIVREEIPESAEGLEKFADAQERIGVDIDRDILQSFSGECVSMKLEIEADNGTKSQQGVTAIKCENPEKIRELLDRAVEALNELPAVQSQELELVDAENLDGFQEIRANVFQGVGVRPVIGFNDGWMVVSSHIEAAKKLVAVRAGDADSIAKSDTLEDFEFETDGPVYAASYSDVGAGIRAAADFIDKAGMMAPMFVGMAAAQAGKENMESLQAAAGLLPSIAKVVRKFDFFEDRLSITQEGPEPNTYLKRTVTQIRQPEEER